MGGRKKTRSDKQVEKVYAELNEGAYGNRDPSAFNDSEFSRFVGQSAKGTGGQMRREKFVKNPPTKKSEAADVVPKVPKAVWDKLRNLKKTAKKPCVGQYRPLNDAYETVDGFFPCPGMRQLPAPKYATNSRATRKADRANERILFDDPSPALDDVPPTKSWGAPMVPRAQAEKLGAALNDLKSAQEIADALFLKH